MRRSILIALGSAIITGVAIKAAPALAQDTAADVQVSFVRTADLDLSTDFGRRQLDKRLANAAREVCGTASDVDVEGKNEVRKCRDEVLTKARSDRDQLFSVAGRGGFIAITSTR